MPGKREVVRTKKNGVKTKQVIKDGVVKKTVTREPEYGTVRKDITRGDKRIKVIKNKNSGDTTRYVYKNDSLVKQKVHWGSSAGAEDKGKAKTFYNPDGSIKRSRSKSKSDSFLDGEKRSYFGKSITKDGVVKKTVTGTPGGVEKEIERGNKRIEVKKYKDEGVKSRTVIDMKKNDQYKDDLKSSSFNRMPKQVYDNAIKNKK